MANEKDFSIELKSDVAKGTYSNLAIITHSRSEFVLDFASMLPGLPKPEVHNRSIMNPELFDKAVFIACGARVTPWLTAWEESQRLALEADPTFRACESLKGGEAGLRCARSIALISYRSYEGYNATQQETDEDCLFADRAGSYQRYQGKKLSDRFDA